MRYAIQIYQTIKTLKNTQKNMDCQRKMKDIDLNKTPNASVLDDHNDHLHDEIIRQRMQEKKKLT